MRKGTLLTKTLSIVVVTLLLSSIITGIVFLFVGRGVFARTNAQELVPRSVYLAYFAAEYQQDRIGPQEFGRILSNDKAIWGASVYVYDRDQTLLAMPLEAGAGQNAIAIALTKYLPRVLQGEALTVIADTTRVGLIIGTPTYGDDGSVIGAVFLTKPLREVNAAMDTLWVTLIVSMIGVMILMLVPAYFGTRTITRPLNQMSGVARAMVDGNFSVRAEERGDGEVAELGHALNTLSGALSSTIGTLTLERNRLRSILNGLGEGILAMDAAGAVTHCNPAVSRLLGGDDGGNPAALPGFSDIVAAMRAALAEASPVSMERNSGEATLLISITPFYSTADGLAGVVALVRDITEHLRLERTRREYVANVSHELRTPLASIRSLADALNDGMVKKEEDKSRYYGYILRESMRLSRLINDLLELSRLQSGAVALKKDRVDMGELLLDIAERYSAVAAESGLRMSYAEPEGDAIAFTNADRIEQVLVALLDNAIRYSPDGGEIHLSAAGDAEALTVCVKNRGSIAPEDINHLFDRFYKVDKAHTGEGTGLGLSIAMEVMTLMQERIWVENADGWVKFFVTVHLV
ncbi:MAG: histidine kinase dimerization/phospho-acceptor domain-containing protein [Bacillota bacterium]